MHDEPAFVALGFKSNRRGLPLEHVRVATDTKSAGQGLLTSYRLSMFALQLRDDSSFELRFDSYRLSMFALQPMQFLGISPAGLGYRLSMFALQLEADVCDITLKASYRLSMFALQLYNPFTEDITR